MTRSFRRQNQKPSGAADKSMSGDSHHARRKHPGMEHSTLLRQSPGARTRLHFEYGANMLFKVVYATLTLQQKSIHLEEQMANIYHTNHIIGDAEEVIKDEPDSADREALVLAVSDLKAQFDLCIASDEFRANIHQRLTMLKSQKSSDVSTLNDVLLEEWYSDSCAFLKHIKPFADDLNLAEDAAAAHNAIERVYQDCLHTVEQNSLIADARTSMTSDQLQSERTNILDQYLCPMGEAEVNTQKSVRARFIRLFNAYELLSILMRDYDQGGFTVSDLAVALEAVHDELAYLLSQTGSEKSLYDQYFDSPVYHTLISGLSHTLAARSHGPVHQVLGSKFQQLSQSTTGSPTMQLEKDFADLAKLFATFAMTRPTTVASEKWEQYAPTPLTHTEANNFMNKLQILYSCFQDKTYNTDERSTLWLAIWRGLKAVYVILRNNNFQLGQVDFPAEKAFFNRSTIRNQFELVLSSPEPLHPVIVENIVAEYCLHIEDCREGGKALYRMLRLFSPTPVQESVLKSINQFARSRTWEDMAMRAIQKSVVRLNHILGGPAYVRRLDRTKVTNLVCSAKDWIIESAKLGTAPSVPPSKKQHVDGEDDDNDTVMTQPRDVQTQSATVTQSNDDNVVMVQPRYGQTQSDNLPDEDQVHAEGGMNIVSAFDYVTYPFPETRALEVAYSRQINREMSQSGIYSQGAMVEDVTNSPPRHVWPPGKISIWAQRLPIGPLDVVKNLLHGDHHDESEAVLGRQVRNVRSARPYPSITPRRPRKEWADQHPRLRPLRDLHTRVTKPVGKVARTHLNHHHHHHVHGNDEAQHSARHDMHHNDHDVHHDHHQPPSPTYVPRMRGGGPKLDPTNQPSDPKTPAASIATDNQLSTAEMNSRARQLYERIRGFWRDATPSFVTNLRERFLIPYNWDVNAGVNAVRRYMDYGTLDPNAMTPDLPHQHHHHQHHQGANDGNPFDITGAYQGPALDPSIGMPVSQNIILPAGRRGVRVPPTSPIFSTPAAVSSDQRADMGSLLQAHVAGSPGQLAAIATSPNNTQNVFTSTGLPSFQIYEDPSVSSPSAASGQNDGFTLVGTQQQQPQIDRQRASLSQRSSANNSSNQENRTPQPSGVVSTPPTPTPNSTQAQTQTSRNLSPQLGLTCDDLICHPCPWYADKVHHICPGQQRQRQPSPSAPAQSTPDLFGVFGIDQQTAGWGPVAASTTPNFHPRPAANDSNPSSLFSSNPNPHPLVTVTSQTNASSDHANQLPSTPPTQVLTTPKPAPTPILSISSSSSSSDISSSTAARILASTAQHTAAMTSAALANPQTSPLSSARRLAAAAQATASAAIAALDAMSGSSPVTNAGTPFRSTGRGRARPRGSRSTATRSRGRGRGSRRVAASPVTDGPASRLRSRFISPNTSTPTPAPRPARGRGGKGRATARGGRAGAKGAAAAAAAAVAADTDTAAGSTPGAGAIVISDDSDGEYTPGQDSN